MDLADINWRWSQFNGLYVMSVFSTQQVFKNMKGREKLEKDLGCIFGVAIFGLGFVVAMGRIGLYPVSVLLVKIKYSIICICIVLPNLKLDTTKSNLLYYLTKIKF